ncbi:MAG: alpha/beta hydrolase family protein [Sandaracinaceae bacterium]
MPVRGWWLAIVLMTAGCGTEAPVDGGAADGGRVGDGGPSDPGAACREDALGACEYRPRQHTTDQVDGVMVDNPAYGRRFPITVRFPTDAEGPIPVIVASHGGTFNDMGHELLGTWGDTLASAGFGVIHIAHVEFGTPDATRLCEDLGIPEAECVADGSYNPGVVFKPSDGVAVLDALEDIAAMLEDARGVRLDPSRVATLGWSGGTQVGLTLLGAERDVSPSVRHTAADDRIAGAMALSPHGPGFSGYFASGSETSMDAVTRPILIATGDHDFKEGNPELLPSIRRQTFDNLPGGAGTQRLLYSRLPVGVGGHGTYNLGDLESDEPRLQRLSLALTSVARAFFDATLRDEAAARAYLDSDAPRVLAGADDTEWSAR